MKKIWLMGLILGLAAAAVMALMFMRDRPEWTSRSPAARAAFERCLDAKRKWYFPEARATCQDALEIDRDFVMARLYLAELSREPEEREAWMEGLRSADLAPLTARERFLVRFALASEDGRQSEARQIVASFLAEHPNDPYALQASCDLAWDDRDFAAAESSYQRLLEIEPNWVEAQNHLGYILMAQGRFQEAENRFLAYRFVAPDQANPYDSMAELLTLTGRYEEAEAALEEALRIRPDFCPAYINLVRLYLLSSRYDAAAEVLERAGAADSGCDDVTTARLRCSVLAWRESARHWDTAWRILGAAGCLEEPNDALVIGHEAAARSGRLAEAAAIEKRLREESESGGKAPESEGQGKANADMIQALLLEMSANRLSAEGQFEEAARAYRAADERLAYWSHAGLGIFKLYIKLGLARALSQQGKEAEAQAVLEQIRAVNPRFAERYRPAAETGEAAAP